MPLSRSGATVLSAMKDQYGADKGEHVFYATAAKKPALGRKWHGRSASPARRVAKR